VLKDRIADFLASAALCCLSVIPATRATAASLPAACRPETATEKILRENPTVSAYGAAGVWFAARNNPDCAIAAFEAALQLDPRSWETRYNLALQRIQRREFRAAEDQLRHALSLNSDLLLARNALGTVLMELNRFPESEDEFRTVLSKDPKSVYALDHLAQALSAQRRYVAALSFWRHALELQPDDPNIELSIAVGHSRNGDPERAIHLLETLVARKPDFAPAQFNLATMYAHQTRFREAADHYARALELDPKDDAARLALAKALTTIGAYEEAIQPCRKYVARNPADWEGHYLLGTIYRGQGDFEKAEVSLRRSVALNPSDNEVYYNLGATLARLGKAREAVGFLEKSLALNPASSSTRFQLATVLRSLGEQERAAKIYGEFREMKKADANQNILAARGNEANALMESGAPLRAAAVYRGMLKLDPANGQTWYNLSLALSKAGDRGGQREALEKAGAADPGLALVQNDLGLLDFTDRRANDAEQHFLQALRLDPQLAQAQGNLAVLRVQQNRMDDAEKLLREAIENDPNYVHAYLNLGLVLAQQDRFREAEAPLERALALAPDDVRILTALGRVQSRNGKSEQAIALLRKASARNPRNVEAHLDLGVALADGFDLNGALQEFSEAVRLAPGSAAAHYNLGRALLDQQQYERAETELEAATRLTPTFAHTYFLRALGWKQSGLPERSVPLLQTAVKLEPGNANSWFLLGQTLQATGREPEAIAAWKRAVGANPEHSESLYNLARFLRNADPVQAQQYQTRLEEIQKKRRITDRAGMLGNFAVTSAANRDWSQAVAQLREAIQVCGECRLRGELHKDLGLIYCRSGQSGQGRSELRTALTLLPGDADVIQALKVVDGLR
jgi:tetratricopeptide (TPR) repeat protein